MHDILLNICSGTADAAGERERRGPSASAGGRECEAIRRHDVNASQQLIRRLFSSHSVDYRAAAESERSM